MTRLQDMTKQFLKLQKKTYKTYYFSFKFFKLKVFVEIFILGFKVKVIISLSNWEE